MNDDADKTSLLHDDVIDIFTRYQNGKLTVAQLAGGLTHRNFDNRMTEEFSLANPHLSHVIADLGPQLEVEPSQLLLDETSWEIQRFPEDNANTQAHNL